MLDEMAAGEVALLAPEHLVGEVAALEWGITAYDALYVLLARDFDAVLVTADERLHTAATGQPVRLLAR